MIEKKNDCIKEKLDWERGVIRQMVDAEPQRQTKNISKFWARKTSIKHALLTQMNFTEKIINGNADYLIPTMALLQIYIRAMAESMGRTEQLEAETTRALAEYERYIEEEMR